MKVEDFKKLSPGTTFFQVLILDYNNNDYIISPHIVESVDSECLKTKSKCRIQFNVNSGINFIQTRIFLNKKEAILALKELSKEQLYEDIQNLKTARESFDTYIDEELSKIKTDSELVVDFLNTIENKYKGSFQLFCFLDKDLILDTIKNGSSETLYQKLLSNNEFDDPFEDCWDAISYLRDDDPKLHRYNKLLLSKPINVVMSADTIASELRIQDNIKAYNEIRDDIDNFILLNR